MEQLKNPKRNIAKSTLKLLGTGAAVVVGVASPYLMSDAKRADAQPNPRGADTTATANPNNDGSPAPEANTPVFPGSETVNPVDGSTTSTTETTTSTTVPETTTTVPETTTITQPDAPGTIVEKNPDKAPKPIIVVDNGGKDGAIQVGVGDAVDAHALTPPGQENNGLPNTGIEADLLAAAGVASAIGGKKVIQASGYNPENWDAGGESK